MDAVFVTHNELGRRCMEAFDEVGGDVITIYTRPSSGNISDQIDFASVARDIGADLEAVDSVNDEEVVRDLSEIAPDLLFVVGWSQLVIQEVIETATVGAIGMHPAPLPKGRGRAPVAWNLIKGREETALSMFRLVEEADAGALFRQHPIEITRRDTAATLNEKIYDAGAQLVRDCARDIVAGDLVPAPQSDEDATWWPRRRPHHGLIDWNRSAEAIHNWIRGQSHPYPGAFSYLDGTKITIWKSVPPAGERVYAKPGEILAVEGRQLAVAGWEEQIELVTIQVDDDKEIQAADLVTEYRFEVGDVFTNARDRLETA